MINKDEMIKRVAFATNLSKDITENVIDSLFENIKDALIKNDKVRFVNFGVFSAKIRKGRVGVNPRNISQPINIQDTRVVKFKPSLSMKKEIKNS